MQHATAHRAGAVAVVVACHSTTNESGKAGAAAEFARLGNASTRCSASTCLAANTAAQVFKNSPRRTLLQPAFTPADTGIHA